MLTAPDAKGRPLYSAKDIVPFYMKHSPLIFPQSSYWIFTGIFNTAKQLSGPKYDGKYLHKIIRDELGETKMHETLTNVVIPAFDVKLLQPIIFSSLEPKHVKSLDVKLSDVTIATSAAPTYLPPHHFTANGEERNLIDGGVAANNPTLLAIREITRELSRKAPELLAVKPLAYHRFRVLSLGTGTQKNEQKYTAAKAKTWGALGWIINGGSTPIIDVFSQASLDMVDIHIATLFQAVNSEGNYLRIQYDDLVGNATTVDVSTKENLDELAKIGRELLKMPVSRVDLDTGKNVPVGDEKNSEALKRFAEMLSEERKLRRGHQQQ